jgi:chromosome segregation ATPase
MTTGEPPQRETTPAIDNLGWVQDQVVSLKTQFGRLQQQGDQLQAALLDVNEKLRDNEARTRDITARTMGLSGMQEQLRQLADVMDRIQDAEVLIDTKFEIMERTTGEERSRDQAEKNELFRRIQDLERRTEGLLERQSAVDDSTRRSQEEVARNHLQAQGLVQRLDAVESKAARNVDAVVRLEQQHGETEQALRALRREDDVVAERARLAHEVAARVETDLHTLQEELRALPLVAERVELLRAERQRLEDRTSHLEEAVTGITTRVEREEDFTLHVDARLKGYDARIDHIHGFTLDARRSITEQLLRLNQMIERMKRREVEEMERQVKELRGQQSQLKSEDE